jgi:hypothetical protein
VPVRRGYAAGDGQAGGALCREFLADAPIELPQEKPYAYHTFVNFLSQCDQRDELQKHLAGKGVQTVVHHNTPIDLQGAAKSLGVRRGQFPGTNISALASLLWPAISHSRAMTSSSSDIANRLRREPAVASEPRRMLARKAHPIGAVRQLGEKGCAELLSATRSTGNASDDPS